jgi:hypothetical protein
LLFYFETLGRKYATEKEAADRLRDCYGFFEEEKRSRESSQEKALEEVR